MSRFRQFGLWVADDEQDKYLDVRQVVDLLNEQQAIINKQQDLIYALKKDNQRLRNGLI